MDANRYASDENPALEVAIQIAIQRGLPLLVYQTISQHYNYASDRHHLFMLQGARDVQSMLSEMGISYAFHLVTREDSAPHLISLSERAAVVFTEEMPVDPPRRFLNSLLAAVETPVYCVDTACVVPMQLVPKPYVRAFKFRDATKKLYQERLTRGWPAIQNLPKPADDVSLPFDPIDLQAANLSELIARCEIDHSVGPVADTCGGSTAGYQRWNQFKENGLGGYARRRNNALLDGVSRMSAYLHYGMVSPMRIAREAAEIDNSGSEKYLDELLIWRELAYNFCFHRNDHDQWSALPEWAQQTLLQHATDDRSEVYSWEELARAQTRDPFWNAAQLSLLRQGELHNNVRMTWGKAVLNWTRCPKTALLRLIDLNHRYALDGRDPASYGGLLWCLGQFDRPFEPAKSIFGTVRPRSTRDHAKRLDTESYLKKVATPRFEPVPTIAVIGAGISGLVAARTLVDHGLDVKIFDKGRGVGGRLSTRRVDGKPMFDHGAQYFTARDSRFQRYVESWLEQGIVARWPDQRNDPAQQIVVFNNGTRTDKVDTQIRYVGVPGMNSVCKHLARDLAVEKTTRVGSIASSQGQIQLTDINDNLLGRFDHVIVSAPAEQSADLLVNFKSMADEIREIRMQPCWAIMATLQQPISDDWVGAFVDNSIVTWAARNGTKPERPAGEHLLLHVHHDWTAKHWEDDPQLVAAEVLQAFWNCSGIQPIGTSHLQAHRWKYAIPVNPASNRCIYDAKSGIAACGDWAGGPRVEGAFLSGMAAAGRILGTVCQPQPEIVQTALFEG